MTPEIQAGPLLHKREVAASRLNVSLRTLDELLATKQLKCVRIGGVGSRKKRVLISEQAIQDFIHKSETSSKRRI